MAELALSGINLVLYGIGSGAVGGFLSQYAFPALLQRHKFNLEASAEKGRALLKRQELMFDRELIAAEQFFTFAHEALKQSAGPANDDIEQYYDGIASNFINIEHNLEQLIRSNGVGLSEKATDLINQAIDKARVGSHEYGQDIAEQNTPDYNLSDETEKYAEELTKLLRSTIKQIRLDLKNGSFG